MTIIMKISQKLKQLYECAATVLIFIIAGCITVAIAIFAIVELFAYAPIPLALFILIMIGVGVAEIIKSI